MVDKVDELILSALSQDTRQHTFELWDYLRGFGYNVPEDEIESRIKAMEERGIIRGYTISIDTKKVPGRVVHIDLVKFRTSQALPKRLEGLKKYLNDAPFSGILRKDAGGI